LKFIWINILKNKIKLLLILFLKLTVFVSLQLFKKDLSWFPVQDTHFL